MPGTHKPLFQFTIRGLLLTTAVIAVGLSIGCLKTAKLEDGLFAAAATWIVIGLVAQIIDLWAAFRQATGLSPDQRSGWWFAILARGALVVLLVGHFLVIELLATKHLTLAGDEEPLSFYWGALGHDTLRSAIFAMSLVLILAGPRGRPTAAIPRRWSTAVNLTTSFGIAVVIYYLLLDRFLVYDLVHIATEGIALGLQRASAKYTQIYSDARALSFFNRAIIASGLIVWDLLCLRLLIIRWKRGGWQRAVLLVALGVSLALTAIHPIWLTTRGLKEVSPFLAEIFSIRPINRWVFGAALTIMFVTAAARRMIPAARNSVDDLQGNWRRRSAAYFHEYRLLSLFVAATTVCMAIRVRLDITHTAYSGVLGIGTLWGLLQFALWASLYDPLYQLWLLVFGLAVYRAMFGVGKKSELLGAAPPELPLSLFAVVWMALLAIVVMAVPIIAALGFGLSLNWWRLPF